MFDPKQEQGAGPGTAVYALTAVGARLGRVLAARLGGDLYLPDRLAAEHGGRPFGSLPPLVGDTWRRYGRHVFVAAAGIAVRAVAPLLAGKDRDPAVVVVDQRGRYAVSLVSGHLGGANALAREVAAVTSGQAVVTTATDVEGVPAVDDLARERGLAVSDPAMIKPVNLALLAGDPIQVCDPEGWLGLAAPGPEWEGRISAVPDLGVWNPARPGVVVSWRSVPPQPEMLVLHPPCLCVGVGCRRGAPAGEIESALRTMLEEEGLALASVLCLGTVTDKQDEEGLLAAAAGLGKGLFFFSPGDLAEVATPNPSAVVERRMGTPSVCEAAALLLSGSDALLVEKRVLGGVTLAVALQA
ncbi:MAG: cobalamin biosynthesis protein [Thermodesulfobacteriota bacterium]